MANEDKREQTLAKVTPLRKPVKCPNCAHKSHRDTYPFCSTRCQDIDLNSWFNGSYAIPVAENDHGMGDE